MLLCVGRYAAISFLFALVFCFVWTHALFDGIFPSTGLVFEDGIQRES